MVVTQLERLRDIAFTLRVHCATGGSSVRMLPATESYELPPVIDKWRAEDAGAAAFALEVPIRVNGGGATGVVIQAECPADMAVNLTLHLALGLGGEVLGPEVDAETGRAEARGLTHRFSRI